MEQLKVFENFTFISTAEYSSIKFFFTKYNTTKVHNTSEIKLGFQVGPLFSISFLGCLPPT